MAARHDGRYGAETGRYFGNSASFWLGLQMDFDLDIAEDEIAGKSGIWSGLA